MDGLDNILPDIDLTDVSHTSLPDIISNDEEEFISDSLDSILAPDIDEPEPLPDRVDATDVDRYYDISQMDELIIDDDDEVRLFFDNIMTKAIQIGASDIHIEAHNVIAFTKYGSIIKDPSFGVVSDSLMERIKQTSITNEAEATLTTERELDISYVIKSGEYKGRRLRANLGFSFGAPIVTLRVINDTVPTPKELGIPQEITDWAQNIGGLILFNGSTGTGKDLPLSTRIVTPDGVVTMGSVHTGDKVLGRDGKPYTVQWAGDVINQPELTQITFENGVQQLAGLGHQWLYTVRMNNKELPFLPLQYSERICRTINSLMEKPEGVLHRVSYSALVREMKKIGVRELDTFMALKTIYDNSSAEVIKTQRYYHVSTLGKISKYFLCLATGLRNGKTGTTWTMMNEEGSCYIPLYLNDMTLQSMTQTTSSAEENAFLHKNGDHERYSANHRVRKAWWLGEPVSSVFQHEEEARHYWSEANSAGVLAFFEETSNGYKVEISDGTKKGMYTTGAVKIDFITPVLSSCRYYEPTRCIAVNSPDNTFVLANGVVTHNSTSIASILREIQLREAKKIITIEKPIEYVYGHDGKSLVVQREVGSDTRDFASGLKSAMRSNPDIILVGEIRDQEEIEAALYAAGSGHLTLSTMHTDSCIETIDKIRSMYEGSKQKQILETVSMKARGFANQQLIKKKDGSGLFAVREILSIDNFDIRQMIANGDTMGVWEYMNERELLMEYQLVQAVKDGLCTLGEARLKAPDKVVFDRILQEKGGDV